MSYKIDKGEIILVSQGSFPLLHLFGREGGHRNPTPTAESALGEGAQ